MFAGIELIQIMSYGHPGSYCSQFINCEELFHCQNCSSLYALLEQRSFAQAQTKIKFS